MQKVSRCCLYLSIILLFYGCSSSIKAPVDHRDKPSTAPSQASYSQSSAVAAQSAEQDRDYHIVARGDTLYSIAWRYGHDYRDVARWNNISGKYVIYPGQFIRLKPDLRKASPLQPGPIVSKQTRPTSSPPQAASQGNTQKPLPRPKNNANQTIVWQWPTKGRLVKLNTPSSKKGLDITGRVGQQVSAAADGDVVYSGSGLLGYGKLIIIKHNDTFLSAYAHNDKLHAKEGETVKAGQMIATMGQGHKGMPILHFEIRKDGTPVNPLQHLPKHSS